MLLGDFIHNSFDHISYAVVAIIFDTMFAANLFGGIQMILSSEPSAARSKLNHHSVNLWLFTFQCVVDFIEWEQLSLTNFRT